ncbi:hypothetical protein GHT06_020258 [Daphnia sinensis]|uniref:Uncharacterized protein n=1 Tax=Daphnia sinensis TaxID=1820382 RepID=A0AAD5PS65_9CRUS|nr:hypothetical protein GHT06_020258 [Daphnia sinensis]
MPQWKHNPPCKAHTILSQMSQTEKLIQQPLQKLHSRFTQNLPSLPCRSFTTTSGSLSNGLELKNSEKSSSSALSCLEDSANSSSTSSLVVSRKRLRDDQESDLNEEIEDLDSRIIHQNQPVLVAVYKDHSLAEIVSICVTLPVMFDIEGLFASAIFKKTMTVEHPKITALKLELENNTQHIDRKPKGSMEISLPIPVKTDPNTVNYKLAKGTGGVIVLMADLCSFHRSYTAI